MTTQPRPPLQVSPFHTTRWTRVCLAKLDSEEGRKALADLCDAYYEPVTEIKLPAGMTVPPEFTDEVLEQIRSKDQSAVRTWKLPVAEDGTVEHHDRDVIGVPPTAAAQAQELSMGLHVKARIWPAMNDGQMKLHLECTSSELLGYEQMDKKNYPVAQSRMYSAPLVLRPDHAMSIQVPNGQYYMLVELLTDSASTDRRQGSGKKSEK